MDAGSGKLYWASDGDLWRGNTDGTAVELIVPFAYGNSIGLALDSGSGKVYWTDVATHRITRANLDGTDIEAVLLELCGAPQGLGIDPVASKMYWSQSPGDPCFGGRIQRANLDGTSIETVNDIGAFFPLWLSLDVEGERVFWRDTLGNRIVRVNFDGTGVENIVTDQSDIVGIAIDSTCPANDDPDFDGDGIPDGCDPDVDGDGVLNGKDACAFTPLGVAVDVEGRPKGDMNNDCVVDGDDVQLFMNQLLGG